MAGGDKTGDDLAVELSWPDAQPVSTRRPSPPDSAPVARKAATGPATPAARAAPKPARQDSVTPAQVLSAIRRVGADVNALTRALADQRRAAAARADGDRWEAALGARVEALETTIEQLRRSLLSALAANAVNPDEPTGQPALQATLEPIVGQQRALGRAVQQLSKRLGDVEPAGVAPGMADVLDTLGRRMASIEAAANRVAEDASVIADRVAPLPARLTAIATQVDRITPLARAGDEAGSLFDHLNRVEAGVDEVAALLRSQPGGPAEADRFAGVVDVLADVSQRQDELAATMGAVLERLTDGSGTEGALDQLQRSLLDALDGTVDKLDGPGGLAGVQAALAGLEPIAGQQRALGRAVQQLSQRLGDLAPGGVDPGMVDALDALAGRLTSIEAAANRVAEDASVIVDRVAPLPGRLTAIATQVDRITPLARAGDDAGSLFDHLNRVEAGVNDAVALLRKGDEGPDGEDRYGAVVEVLAGVSHQQEELAARLDHLADRADLAAVLERGEQRGQLLAERLDRIEAQLQRRDPGRGGPAGGAAIEDTLLGVLEHLTTLSSLVTGTSKASSAEMEALELRIARGLADRPPLTDADVRRIADAVTQNLLENVRVETEPDEG